MADDDRVYKLTWVFEGQRFTASINETQANAISKMEGLEKADIQLTNITTSNVRKRVAAVKEEDAAKKAALSATAGSAAAFTPATERIVTSLGGTATRQLNAAEGRVNAFGKAVRQAQADVATFEKELERTKVGGVAENAEKAKRALDGLTGAYQRLADIQDKAALSSSNANDNLSVLDAAARNLRGQIDPLSVAQREYGQAVAIADTLLEKHKITQTEFSDAIRVAKFNFEGSAGAIRREAQATYDALIAASARYKASLANDRVASSKQLTSAGTAATQLEGSIASGRPVDPRSKEEIGSLTDEMNRLAKEEEAASESAQKLRDSLDPVGAVVRELESELNSYDDLLDRHKLTLTEVAALENKAFSSANIKIGNVSGLTAALKEIEQSSKSSMARLEELRAKFDPVTTSAAAFARELGTLYEAQRLGVNIAGGYEAALDKIYRKFGQLTEAELRLQEVESKSFSGENNKELFRVQVNKARADAASPETIAAGRAESDAQAANDAIEANNKLLGINEELSKAARDSAEAFELEAAASERATAALKAMAEAGQAVRNSLNPIANAQRIYNEEVTRLKTLLTSTDITLVEHDKAVRLASYDLSTTTRSATREAETSYASLTAAITRYNTAVASRPTTAVPAVVTAAGATATTLKTAATTGERLDPAVTEATVKQREEITKLAVEQEKLTASSQRLKDELDPVGAIMRQLTADLAAYSDMEKQGAIDANELAAAEKRARDAANIKINDITGVSASVAKAADDYDRLTKVANQYKQTLNPLIGLQAQYRTEIAKVNEAVSVNLLTQREANEILGDFVQREKDVTIALTDSEKRQLSNKQIRSEFGTILRQGQKDLVAYGSTATKAFGLSRIGMLEFQAAGVNTFQALAAGMNPLQVATMEGAQFIGAFVQSGLKIGTLIGVVAPLAAVAAAIFAVTARILTVNTNLREFSTNLTLFGQGSNQTPESLQKIVDNLRQIGVASGDAKKAILEIFKGVPQGLNINFAETIAKTALDISASAVGTQDFVSETQALTAALTGGVKGLEDYASKLGVFSQAGDTTIQKMDELAKVGDVPKALALGLKAVTDFFSGTYDRSLSEGRRTTIALVNAFNDLIKTFQESELGKAIITSITDVIVQTTRLISDLDRLDKIVGVSSLIENINKLASAFNAVAAAFQKVDDKIRDAGAPLRRLLGIDRPTGSTIVTDRVLTRNAPVTEGAGFGTRAQREGDIDERAMGKTTTATEELKKSLDESKKSLDNYIAALIKANTSYIKPGSTIVADTGTTATSSTSVVSGGAGFGTRSRREGDLDRSGVGTFTTPRLSVASGVNLGTSDDIKKLNDILAKAVDTLDPKYTAQIISEFRRDAKVAGTGQPSLHGVEGGKAVDVQITGPQGVIKAMGADPTGVYKKLDEAVLAIQKRDYPELTGKMAIGTTFRKTDAGHYGIEAGRGVTTTADASATDDLVKKNNLLEESFAKLTKRREEDLAVDRLFPGQQEAARAALEARRAEEDKATSQQDPARAAALALADAQAKIIIEQQKQSIIAGVLATNTLKTTEEFQKNEVAGIRQAAMTQAVNEGLTSAVDIRSRYNQILLANATESVLSSQKEITAFNLTISANQRLADTTAIGTAAAHDADLQNQAVLRTHNALALAEAAGDENVKKLAKTMQDATLEQLKYNDALLQTKSAREAINNLKNEQQALQLQVGITSSGAVPENITRQLDNFKAILRTQQEWADLSEPLKKQYLDIVDATGRWKIRLAEVEEEQRRINDTIKSIVDSISTELTGAIDLAFDGAKPKAWGDRIKDVIKDVLKSVGENQFIKPILGSIADSLGFSSAAKSLGTIPGLSTSTADTATTTTTTTAADGTKTTTTTGGTSTGTSGIGGSTITGALGLGSSLSTASSAAKGGTVTDYLNNEIGPALGFAKTSVSRGEPISSTVAGPTEPGTTVTSGGLFGSSSTLTSTVGGAITGAGTGATVASLTGGNVTNGTIGGLIGGAAGTAIAGPVGGFIGGALGGAVGGLFGPKTKTNDAAGADINLTTGKLTRQVGSKNEASNQDVSDITSSVKSFARTFATDTGVKTDISLAVQSGLRDGIKIGYSGGGLSGLGEKTFKTAADAIDQIELDIAHNLTGISGTMKTVLDQVTDAGDIADAVTFAKTYDDLKKAADDAFSSIEDDTDKIGPYAEAFNTLNDTFDDLTISAEQFGLSLDPINDGLKEATKRLQDDFGKSLDAALDTANAKDYINTLQDVSDAYTSNLKDAQAIGLTDETTLGKIDKLEVAKARVTLDDLTSKELSNVIDSLGESAPELAALATSMKAVLDADADTGILKLTADNLATIYTDLKDTNPALASLAKSLTDTSTSADDAVKAVEDLAAGITSLADLSKSLKSGELSGLTETGAAKSAITTYKRDLETATTAGAKITATQIDDLVKSGEAAVKASVTAYGNAPKTADLRRQIIKDLASVGSLADTAATTLITEGAKAGDVKNTTIPTTVATEQSTIKSGIIDDTTTAADTTTTTTVEPIAKSTAAIGTDQYAADYYGVPLIPAYASGTVPGPIIVGEKGPEWMRPSGGEKWVQVGKQGPEIINQKGGATILPFPVQPKDWMGDSKGYAGGTSSVSNVSNISNVVNMSSYSRGTKEISRYLGGTIADVENTPNMSSYAQGTGGRTDDLVNTNNSMAAYANGTSFVSDANNTVSAYMGGTSMGGMPMVGAYMGGTPDTASTGAGPMMAYAVGISSSDVPAYAEGMPEATIPAIDTSTAATDSNSVEAVVLELRSLRKENLSLHEDLVAIKKQIQGGDTQAMNDARTGHSRLSSIDSKLGSGLVTPPRRAVG